MEVNALKQQGHLRLEPHPTTPGAYRILADNWPDQPCASRASPICANDATGQRKIAEAMVGCPGMQVAEESRMPMARAWTGDRREQIAIKVTCG